MYNNPEKIHELLSKAEELETTNNSVVAEIPSTPDYEEPISDTEGYHAFIERLKAKSEAWIKRYKANKAKGRNRKKVKNHRKNR